MSILNIALLFGGVSSEHDVSRVSAKNFGDSLSPERYAIHRVGITKDGRWLYYTGPADKMPDGSWEQDENCRPCVLSPDRSHHGLLLLGDGKPEIIHIDVAVPALHGKNGEDGTMQGLFELAGIPYVGCGVLASAVCMDKAVANALLDAAGIPRCAWDWANRWQCETRFDSLADHLEQKLGYPIFVKPANAGSSVGISKAENREQLKTAVDVALKEDDKLVFERFVKGHEVECAVIGNDPCVSTLPGEILASEEFYTYEDKYLLGQSRTLIPANLPEQKLREVKDWAEKAYTALGCEGLARCDFFVEDDGSILINEINTLPGFTAISMYPKLMEAAGTPAEELADRLIQLALDRAEAHNG